MFLVGDLERHGAHLHLMCPGCERHLRSARRQLEDAYGRDTNLITIIRRARCAKCGRSMLAFIAFDDFPRVSGVSSWSGMPVVTFVRE